MSRKCLIVTTHYKPLIGGAQAVYDALAAAAPDHFTVLTASSDPATGLEVEGWRDVDASAPYEVRRIEAMRAPVLTGRVTHFVKLRSRLQEKVIRRRVLGAVEAELRGGAYGAVCIGALDALGWLIPLLRKRVGVPVYIYTHGEEISQKPYSDKADEVRRQSLKSATGIVAVSSFTASLITEKYGVPAARVRTITNGVDLERFCDRPAENVRRHLGLDLGPLVLSLGRLVDRKGFDKLIEAWPRIQVAVPQARLAIAGTGPQEAALQSTVEEQGTGDSITFLGRVAAEMLPSLYASADLFVMPNRTMPDGDTEGFGLVFLEAAASGTPSVGGAAGGAVDAVRHGETGLLVDGGDVSAIAFAVTDMLTDEVKRKSMGQAAMAFAQTQGWPDKAVEVLSFFGLMDTGNKAATGADPVT